MTLKIVTVVGARPQFIKAAAVSRVFLEAGTGVVDEVVVHTGQHFDANMSQVFFDDLDIPKPRYNLDISGGHHGAMTGRMLKAIERVLLEERPDWLLIYGDTNSTLAAALAAAKLHIPIAHVEAGLRSFNRAMPEEINRVMADHVSTLLLCPTEAAVQNLSREGCTTGVHNVGDVMYDAALFYRDRAVANSTIKARLGLADRGFALATCHRAENTDDPQRLSSIMDALAQIALELPVVLTLHPRTRQCLRTHGLDRLLKGLTVVEPLPFLDMIALEQAAGLILTDSGGVQKEAFFYGVPCLTMRDETEWVETVRLGANTLVGASTKRIIQAWQALPTTPEAASAHPYGTGDASQKVLERLLRGA
jgi:UDP-GlcNAc3NAcA epimerase